MDKSIMKMALNTLTPNERAIYVLKRHGGFRYREIGELLKIKEGTVSSTISKAREKIFNHMNKYKIEIDTEI